MRWTRNVGVATAMAAVTLIGLPGVAGALTSMGDIALVGLAEPDVYRSENNQPAGDLRLRAMDGDDLADIDVVEGEQIVIEVNDAAGGNCTGASSARFIGFSELPDIAVSAGPGVSLTAALRSSTAPLRGTDPCDGFIPATQDQLVLSVTQAPAEGGILRSVRVSDIRYDVGALAAAGDVTILIGNDGDVVDTTDSANAYITNLEVTSSGSGAVQPGSNRPLAPIVLRETQPDSTTPAGTQGFVCVTETSGRLRFVSADAVVTSGSDTVTPPTFLDGGSTLRFRVTDAAVSSESTFRLQNIRVNTVAGEFGPADFDVQQCDGTADTLTPLPIVPGTEPTTPDLYTDDIRPAAVGLTVERLGGADRFATAADIAIDTFGCADTAVLARGDDFADALAGTFVAGLDDGPVLLTQRGAVPAATAQALRELGVTEVVVMGGTAAVTPAVAAALDAMPAYTCGGGAPIAGGQTLTVRRVAGSSRAATAAAAATSGGTAGVGRLGGQRTAIVVGAFSFADAVSAGPLAYGGVDCAGIDTGADCAGFPLLLIAGATIPVPTADALDSLGIQRVLIVGGTATVPESIATRFQADGLTVTRLAGGDRMATAVDVATFARSELNFGRRLMLARGDDFADALAGGPRGGELGAPVLLTASPTSLGGPTQTYLASLVGTIDFLDVLGLQGAISDAVVAAAVDALTPG